MNLPDITERGYHEKVFCSIYDFHSPFCNATGHHIRICDTRVLLEIVDGDMQVGKPGETFENSLVVKLTDINGLPVPNATIRFC